MNIDSEEHEDLLEFRKQESSNFLWISKPWAPQVAFDQGSSKPTPNSHKKAVLHCPRIQELLTELSTKQNIPKSQLENQVKKILDEIGYDRKLKLIRWLGLVLTKICLKVLSGIYVNPAKLEQIKSAMGKCPVVFVPSHRSYGDFILMSYLNFTYDIEIPAIAAGMDFYGMWGMGSLLRDTGAFFMRRSYNNDSLYWETFREYVSQIVRNGDLPLEFFIEGTRSRSNKSLSPKFGLLNMILKSLFLAQVPDILFVPIGISYDRILEESLFAYELLGVPKPKETTSGLFKSLKLIKEKYGDIYIHLDEPISAKRFFGDKLDRSVHSLGSVHNQEITEDEKKLLPPLADEILHRQQRSIVLMTFNLMALVLNDNFAGQRPLLSMAQLCDEVDWIKSILAHLGAPVATKDTEKDVTSSFLVHNNLVGLNMKHKVCLISDKVTLDGLNPVKLKGHALSDATMSYSVPFVMLQIYVNPALQYLVDMAVICIILSKEDCLNEDKLFEKFHSVRSIFSKEFVTYSEEGTSEFRKALDHALWFDLIRTVHNMDNYQLGENLKFQEFLLNAIKPFSISYSVIFNILQKLPPIIDEKSILQNAQRILEVTINESEAFVHPYCLNLDSLTICLSSFCNLGALKRIRRNDKNMYEINSEKLKESSDVMGAYFPKYSIEENSLEVMPIQNKL
ncbi:unnamed protein product [Phaedon cochleariae]|uniref:Phospholipid/glycerol acyltransferase domain-containing protein n=1 Tax=Phaedon cochleariae TaxID=80249 RepID=A0A9P0GNJ5_PHACE|nr:unnamed protein product [Phaedon cochleariae]